MRTALALVLAALTACGRASGPVEIPAKDLPFSVTRTENPARTTEPVGDRTVYLVRDGLLSEHRRELDAGVPPAAAVLQALLAGPTREERTRGVSTLIPSEVRLLGADVADGAARVDLSGEFQEPAGPEEIVLRVAQVVWTLTSLPSVESVSFAIDGDPVAVTADDGAAVDRRVTREDYERLAPPR